MAIVMLFFSKLNGEELLQGNLVSVLLEILNAKG